MDAAQRLSIGFDEFSKNQFRVFDFVDFGKKFVYYDTRKCSVDPLHSGATSTRKDGIDMKRRSLSLFLSVVFLLSVFLFATTAFANSGAADGLEANLVTDKDAYVAGDKLEVKLEITNTSLFVTNIRTKLTLPENLSLVEGTPITGAVDLAPGSSHAYDYVLEALLSSSSTTEPGTTTTVPGTSGTTAGGTTAGGTAVGGTTAGGTTGGDGGPAQTGDYLLLLYGGLAVLSLAALIALTFGAKLLKQRWFVLILCAAVLTCAVAPAAASAATADKSFDITKTVTVDGVAAQIKATLVYDLGDTEPITESVSFKEDGVSLYKLVGETYYTANSITLNNVKCDYAWRHEVLAPYLETLFGDKDATFAGKFDNSKIVSDTAEKELLVGATDCLETRQALSMIDYDQWIITRINGKIVVAGWYDASTVAAAEHLYDLVKDQDDATLELPIIQTVESDLITDIPTFDTGYFGGGIDGDEDTLVLRYTDVQKADFDAYIAKLVAAGYEKYQENAITNYGDVDNLFATYVNGDKVVHVYYAPFVLGDVDPDTLTKAQSRSFRPDGNEIRIITDSADHLFTNAENNVYTDAQVPAAVSYLDVVDTGAENPASLCAIYTLADGSFLVVDSGMPQDAQKLYLTLKALNKREDGEIVVAAWIMSHGHLDHYGGLSTLVGMEKYASKITIEQFISNPASDYATWRFRNHPYQYSGSVETTFLKEETLREQLAGFKNSEDIKYVHPHLGQKMYIRNAVVEILYSVDEDHFPVVYNNDNDTSMVFTVELADTKILNLNDSASDTGSDVLWPLFSQALDCDIVHMAHHGLGGNSSGLYELMDPEVVVWTTLQRVIDNHGFMDTWGDNIKNAELHVVAEGNVKTLYLPFDVETDEVVNTELEEIVPVKEGYLMNWYANSFGVPKGGADSYKAVIEELKSNNAAVVTLNHISLSAAGVTAEQVAQDAEYEYYHYVQSHVDANGKTFGHIILSHYPMTVLEDIDATSDPSGEGRAFAHVVVDWMGDEIDLYAGVGGGNEDMTDLIATVAETVSETQRPFIVSSNDMRGINASTTEFAGQKVYSYFHSYNTNVLFSKNLGVYNESHVKSTKPALDWGGVDMINLFEVELAVPVKENTFMSWYANSFGISANPANYDILISEIKEQNAAVVALKNISLSKAERTAEEVAADARYPYYHYTQTTEMADGSTRGNLILSHYPLTPQDDIVVATPDTDAYDEGRAFAHAIVDWNGVSVDVYAGAMDGTTAAQRETLEAAVKAVSDETGRSFIVSGNDMGNTREVTEYAGRPVYSYFKSYDESVMISNDDLIVDSVEHVATQITWAGVDPQKHLFNLSFGQGGMVPIDEDAFLNWYANSFGIPGQGSGDAYADLITEVRNRNAAVVALEHVSITQANKTPAEVAADAGYPYYHYTKSTVNSSGKENGHIILSHYPLTALDDIVLVAYTDTVEGRAFAHVIVDWDGVDVELFVGAIGGGDTTSQAALQTAVQTAIAESGNPFIVAGANLGVDGATTSYAGEEVYVNNVYSKVIAGKDHITVNSATSGTSESPALQWAGLDTIDLYSLTITAPVPDAPVSTNTATFGVFPSFRFGGKYDEHASTIIADIKAMDVDLLAVTLIDQTTDYYNKSDVIEKITDALADVYPYYYYAPVWTLDAEGDTVGHLILSKFEILSEETIITTEGTYITASPMVEGRGFAHVKVALNADTAVDVYATHMGAATEWTAFAESFNPTGDHWVIMGATKIGGDPATVDSYLGTTGTASVQSADRTIFLSKDLTYANVVNDNRIASDTGLPNPDPATLADITFPVNEPEPEPQELKVVMLPAFRFESKYATLAEGIHAALEAQDADVLVLTVVDQNSSRHNNSDVPAALAAALAETYPHAWYGQTWQCDENQYMGILILSKYEILEHETVIYNEGTFYGAASFVEGRGFVRAMLDVNGIAVDVFVSHMGSQEEWDGDNGFAAMIKESTADAWIATGNMRYANPEKSGIESKLGQTISCAFEGYAISGGGYHMCNIIGGASNVTISNGVRDTNVSVYGAHADPLYSATVTITP